MRCTGRTFRYAVWPPVSFDVKGKKGADLFFRVSMYAQFRQINLFPFLLQTQAVITGHVCRNSLFPLVFTSVYMGCYTAHNQFPRIRPLSGGIRLLPWAPGNMCDSLALWRFLGFSDDESGLYAADRSPIYS